MAPCAAATRGELTRVVAQPTASTTAKPVAARSPWYRMRSPPLSGRNQPQGSGQLARTRCAQERDGFAGGAVRSVPACVQLRSAPIAAQATWTLALPKV